MGQRADSCGVADAAADELTQPEPTPKKAGSEASPAELSNPLPLPDQASASSGPPLSQPLARLAAAAGVLANELPQTHAALPARVAARSKGRKKVKARRTTNSWSFSWDGHDTVHFSAEAEAFADALQTVFTDFAVEEPVEYDGLWGAFLHQAVPHACDRTVLSEDAGRPSSVCLPDVTLAAPVLPIAVRHRRMQSRQMMGTATTRATGAVPSTSSHEFCKVLLSCLPAVDGMKTVDCTQAASRMKKVFSFIQGGQCVYHNLVAFMTDDGPLDLVRMMERSKLPEVVVPADLQVAQDPLQQIEQGKALLFKMHEAQTHAPRNGLNRLPRRDAADDALSQPSPAATRR